MQALQKSQAPTSITSKEAGSSSPAPGKTNHHTEPSPGGTVPIGFLYQASPAKTCEPLYWLLLGSALVSRQAVEEVLALNLKNLPTEVGRMAVALRVGREALAKELERYGVRVTDGPAWQAVCERIKALVEVEAIRSFKARVQAAAALKSPQEFREWLQKEMT